MKRFYEALSARVRIPLLALAVFGMTFSVSRAQADTVHLFVYNTADGWTTTIHYSNPTSVPVSLPGGLIVGAPGYHGDTVAPHGTSVQPTTGSTVIDVDVDPALIVQTELTTPTGSKFRLDPLKAGASHTLFDLVPAGNGFNSGIVVIAASDTMVDVDGYDFLLKAGEMRVLSNTGTSSVVTNTWKTIIGTPNLKSGDLYVFGYETKWDNGSIFGIQAK